MAKKKKKYGWDEEPKVSLEDIENPDILDSLIDRMINENPGMKKAAKKAHNRDAVLNDVLGDIRRQVAVSNSSENNTVEETNEVLCIPDEPDTVKEPVEKEYTEEGHLSDSKSIDELPTPSIRTSGKFIDVGEYNRIFINDPIVGSLGFSTLHSENELRNAHEIDVDTLGTLICYTMMNVVTKLTPVTTSILSELTERLRNKRVRSFNANKFVVLKYAAMDLDDDSCRIFCYTISDDIQKTWNSLISALMDPRRNSSNTEVGLIMSRINLKLRDTNFTSSLNDVEWKVYKQYETNKMLDTWIELILQDEDTVFALQEEDFPDPEFKTYKFDYFTEETDKYSNIINEEVYESEGALNDDSPFHATDESSEEKSEGNVEGDTSISKPEVKEETQEEEQEEDDVLDSIGDLLEKEAQKA